MADAAWPGREVRAYGEMVALLWDAGDVLGAIELEKLWNELARDLNFSLWCAHHGHSLAVHEHADELHEVWRLCSKVGKQHSEPARHLSVFWPKRPGQRGSRR